MATARSYFHTFISLILLLFHLGCFIFTSTNDHSSSSSSSSNKKRKVNPSSPFSTTPSPSSHLNSKPKKALSSSWTFFKQFISSFKNPTKTTTINNSTLPSPTLSSSARSSIAIINPCSDTIISSSSSPLPPPRKRRTGSCSDPADISFDHRSFPLRNDIFPCPTCGEIFHKPQHVDQHQSIKHAITELYEGDSGKNVVRIIFKTGWNNKVKNPTIHRVLKIHNSPKILRRFEEYRELVKSKELARSGVRRRDERCVADGNELLRFHCSTFICNLGQNGNSSICTQQYCSVCGIIRSGFSAKMDGISTVSNSWRAHVSIPDELEEEFAFMNVKRAMLICRVVAGRIGSDQRIVDKGDAGFDSVIGTTSTGGGGGGGGGGRSRSGGGTGTGTGTGVNGGGTYCRLDEDELLVFNPRAVLPCFAIIYSV